MKKNPFLALRAWLGLALAPAALLASDVATGTIEGRVSNLQSGEYIEGARLAVEGTSLAGVTDVTGHYRIANVPAGAVRLRVAFTGIPSQTAEVTVTPGKATSRDFNLAAVHAAEAVRLPKFIVSATTEMDAAAIAINEQRYASNIRDVSSTDEFGGVSEGSVGEFLRLMPSVNIEYAGGNAREVSINGVPSANVPITIDGFDMASSGGLTTTNSDNRPVELDIVAINNMSRIEVVHSPTAESPGSALAGSINMVSRSAFSRVRPEFKFSAYVLMRDEDLGRDFRKTPGPQETWTRKVLPGFDFSYINPVNKNFGFTISGGRSEQYANEQRAQNYWRGVRTQTNGNAFPHTTVDNPYLTQFNVGDVWGNTKRTSLGISADISLARNDRLSFSLQYGAFDRYVAFRDLSFVISRVLPGDFNSRSTRGAVGGGSLTMARQNREVNTYNYMPSLKWYHRGPVWNTEAGLAHSRAFTRFHDVDLGGFARVTVQRTGVTVRFDDITPERPRTIAVTDGATGTPVDPYNLGSYAVRDAAPQQNRVDDTRRTAYANIRRDFAWRVPFGIKTGLDIRQLVRDGRGDDNGGYPFVGADGRASTTPTAAGSDDGALAFLDESVLSRAGNRGFPNIQMISPSKFYAYFTKNPTHFALNEVTAYRNVLNRSKHAEELVSAAFVRGDLDLLRGRVNLIGGLRAEQTNTKGEGFLLDPTRNVQRDANNEPRRGPNGAVLPITTDPLAAEKLTRIDRGAHNTKEYIRYFPSVNASFSLRDNLLLRASHYRSLGRPSFAQFTSGLTLPDTDLGPLPNNRISVSNSSVKPWMAWTTKVRLEYYFQRVGAISVGAFRRDFENFFATTVFNATPEFLAVYGLNPAVYGDYTVSAQTNLDRTVRMEGLDFSYKQALTFLPPWARGIQVFANANTLRIAGSDSADFSDFKVIPRSGSWGISLTRQKFGLRVNWMYNSRQRRDPQAGSGAGSIAPDTFNWFAARLVTDIKGEYYFYKRWAAFFNAQNVTGEPAFIQEIGGQATPEYARASYRSYVAPLWTLGVKGTY